MKIISFLVSIIICFSISAQNTIRFSQLNFGQGINNPSALAIDGKLMVDLIGRNQWYGFKGAPTTIALNGQYELNQNMAVGLNVFHDRIGASVNNSFAGQFAYRLNVDSYRFFALGVGLGIDNSVLDLGAAQTTDSNDPAFSFGSFSRTFLNGSFGIYYNSPKFYIGASIPKLFQTTRTFESNDLTPKKWNYFLSSGFYFDVGDNYTFNPHIQIKGALNTPLTADLILRNTLGLWSFTVGYRTENSIIAGVDFLLSQNFRVGYSFNYSIDRLANAKASSNELYLGFAFPYRSDRYDFERRRYIGRKGKPKSDWKRNSKKKYKNKGVRFGRGKKRSR